MRRAPLQFRARHSFFSRLAFVIPFLAFSLLVDARPAFAFCRTTTCEPELETCARDERGCVTTGTALRWTKLPLIYRVSARGSTAFDRDEARTKLAGAFDRWTQAICSDGRRTSLRVVEGDAMPEDKPLGQKRGPEPFGIYFRDDTWPYASATTTLAITNQEYGKESGRIIYSDIEVNSRKTPLAILELVVTHEAGHYIGLAHSEEPGSIMAASYNANSNIENPSADDFKGVCELFPPDGLPPEDDDDGCHVTSNWKSDPSPPVAPLLALALVPVILRRARRHHRRHIGQR